MINDFYEEQSFNGRVFSRLDLKELDKMKSVEYFLKGRFYEEICIYALPFIEKEDLKSRRNLDYDGKK